MSRRRWTCQHCKGHFSTVLEFEVTRVPEEPRSVKTENYIYCVPCLLEVGGFYVGGLNRLDAFNVKVLRSGADEQHLKDTIESLTDALKEYVR